MTRVLLADDHAILRRGLATMLEEEPDFTVVGEAGNGREAVDLAREKKPHLVIMDVAMPELNGVSATQQIVRLDPAIRVIVLSMHCEPNLVREMLRAGAAGYVLKVGVFNELLEAIRTVRTGQHYLSPQIASTVVSDYLSLLQSGHTDDPVEVLTPREREVVQLIAEGHSTKEIAFRLKSSPKTIDSHRRNVLDKLQLHSLADLIKFAIREGLSPIDV